MKPETYMTIIAKFLEKDSRTVCSISIYINNVSFKSYNINSAHILTVLLNPFIYSSIICSFPELNKASCQAHKSKPLQIVFGDHLLNTSLISM